MAAALCGMALVLGGLLLFRGPLLSVAPDVWIAALASRLPEDAAVQREAGRRAWREERLPEAEMAYRSAAALDPAPALRAELSLLLAELREGGGRPVSTAPARRVAVGARPESAPARGCPCPGGAGGIMTGR